MGGGSQKGWLIVVRAVGCWGLSVGAVGEGSWRGLSAGALGRGSWRGLSAGALGGGSQRGLSAAAAGAAMTAAAEHHGFMCWSFVTVFTRGKPRKNA